MHPYALLGAAIAAELLGTTALKLSEGFSRPLWSIVVVIGYGTAFYLVSLTLEELPLGIVYGTWTALGIVGVVAIGVAVFEEPLDVAAIAEFGLIVAGIYLLNVVSDVAAH